MLLQEQSNIFPLSREVAAQLASFGFNIALLNHRPKSRCLCSPTLPLVSDFASLCCRDELAVTVPGECQARQDQR